MADLEEIKRNLQKIREEHEAVGVKSVSHDAELHGDGAVAQGQDSLETCDFLIPLLSASSAHSEMVEYEVSSAHQLARARENGL
jgi:hypothetical protein